MKSISFTNGRIDPTVRTEHIEMVLQKEKGTGEDACPPFCYKP
jgi:hypothetical protein